MGRAKPLPLSPGRERHTAGRRATKRASDGSPPDSAGDALLPMGQQGGLGHGPSAFAVANQARQTWPNSTPEKAGPCHNRDSDLQPVLWGLLRG